MLTVWQFKQWHLVQLTDGREPATTDEYRDGWAVFGQVAATEGAVGKIALKSSRRILDEVELQGWSQLWKDELQPSWVERNVKPV